MWIPKRSQRCRLDGFRMSYLARVCHESPYLVYFCNDSTLANNAISSLTHQSRLELRPAYPETVGPRSITFLHASPCGHDLEFLYEYNGLANTPTCPQEVEKLALCDRFTQGESDCLSNLQRIDERAGSLCEGQCFKSHPVLCGLRIEPRDVGGATRPQPRDIMTAFTSADLRPTKECAAH